MGLKSDLNAMFEYAYAQSAKRTGKKVPVVVEGRLFSSITDAAYWLAHNRRDLWEGSKAAREKDAHRVMRNLIARVRNWCGTGGGMCANWFLVDVGDPDTWDHPGADDVIEDLRK
jgi:hypothetical protein